MRSPSPVTVTIHRDKQPIRVALEWQPDEPAAGLRAGWTVADCDEDLTDDEVYQAGERADEQVEGELLAWADSQNALRREDRERRA